MFDGRLFSADGNFLQKVILLGLTLFTLALAGLGGRIIRNIALWKTEYTCTMGVCSTLRLCTMER